MRIVYGLEKTMDVLKLKKFNIDIEWFYKNAQIFKNILKMNLSN